MLRILHVTGGMDRGGLETLLVNLHKHIDRSKIQFDYLIQAKKPQAYEEDIKQLGGIVYRTSTKGKDYFRYKRFLNEFFERHPEHKIVHGHLPNYAAIYLSEAKKHGKIAIVHSHNTKSPEIKDALIRIINYPVRYIADYFFACSPQAGIDHYGRKVNIRFLHNGIDSETYRFSEDIRRGIRRSRGIQSDNTLILGHVGRLDFQKNHKFLVSVFKCIHEKMPDSKLWLIGRGTLEEDIHAQVHSLGLDDAADFIGG